MSAIHFSMDMQRWESDYYTSVAWTALEKNILTTIPQLDALGVPTFNVAFVDDQTYPNVPETVDQFRTVQKLLLQTNANAGFTIRAQPESLAGIKKGFSAGQSRLIMEYLYRLDPEIILLSGVTEAQGNNYDDCCVTATACDFQKAGYQVTIIAENTNNQPHGRFSNLSKRRTIHRPLNVGVEHRSVIIDRIRTMKLR